MGSSSLPEALGGWASPGTAGSLWTTWPEAISCLRKEALWRQGAGGQKALAQSPQPCPSQTSGSQPGSHSLLQSGPWGT